MAGEILVLQAEMLAYVDESESEPVLVSAAECSCRGSGIR
jgi:hypothetical protein